MSPTSTLSPQVIIIFVFRFKSTYLRTSMKGLPGKQGKTKQNPIVPMNMNLHHQERGTHSGRHWNDKSGHWTSSAKSLNSELICSSRGAMQDEDGYITLNIKPRKPTLSSGKKAHSAMWTLVGHYYLPLLSPSDRRLNFICVFLNNILSLKQISGAYRGFCRHG